MMSFFFDPQGLGTKNNELNLSLGQSELADADALHKVRNFIFNQNINNAEKAHCTLCL